MNKQSNALLKFASVFGALPMKALILGSVVTGASKSALEHGSKKYLDYLHKSDPVAAAAYDYSKDNVSDLQKGIRTAGKVLPAVTVGSAIGAAAIHLGNVYAKYKGHKGLDMGTAATAPSALATLSDASSKAYTAATLADLAMDTKKLYDYSTTVDPSQQLNAFKPLPAMIVDKYSLDIGRRLGNLASSYYVTHMS